MMRLCAGNGMEIAPPFLIISVALGSFFARQMIILTPLPARTGTGGGLWDTILSVEEQKTLAGKWNSGEAGPFAEAGEG
jgi:hypothetical protein